jgi:hypothetical protein
MATRGRPSKNLTPYRDQITELFQNGAMVDNILRFLKSCHNIEIGKRTLERALSSWDVKKNTRTSRTSQLRARISVLFFQCCLEDKDMLRALQQEGYKISYWTLQRIRREMGLVRRISPSDVEEVETKLLEIVQKELDNGFIEGLGRNNLHAYFRSRMHIVSR